MWNPISGVDTLCLVKNRFSTQHKPVCLSVCLSIYPCVSISVRLFVALSGMAIVRTEDNNYMFGSTIDSVYFKANQL